MLAFCRGFIQTVAMYLERTLSPYIAKASNFFPVVLITGPRQVGKTTIFESAKSEQRTYITLDDPMLRTLAQNDPQLFLSTYKAPILIDEVQYAPQLFPYIKMIVDKEKKPGAFWLTGSQVFTLMKNVTESLAGRVGILELQGLSQSEKAKFPNRKPFLPTSDLTSEIPPFGLNSLYDTIFKGSYPAVVANKDAQWQSFYRSYVSTYIERDVKQILNITQEGNFIKFLSVAAARAGQLLNYSDMARDCDVSIATIKSWISVLNTSGIIYLLYPYSNNITKRAIKTPKLYFYDTGLVCYLCRIMDSVSARDGIMSGALMETYAISEIIKSYIHNGLSPNMFFYRDKDGKEIDLILEENMTLYPIEIKRTATPTANDMKNFDILESIKGNKQIGEGAIVCLHPQFVPMSRNVVAIPVSYI